MNLFFRKLAINLAVVLSAFSTAILHADVGGDNPTGISGQFNGNVTTGCSYDPYTANATRSITDLVVAGGVGTYPLAFTRTMNSRYTTGVTVPFGPAGGWNHSFGWSMDSITVVHTGAVARPATYSVNYPDGRRIVFSNTGTGDVDFRGPAGARDRFEILAAGGTECYVRLPDGGRVWFHATINTTHTGSGTSAVYTSVYSYGLAGIIDPYGQTTTVSTSGSTTTVTEPSRARTLQIVTRAITSTSQGAVNDIVVDHVTASDGRTVQYSYTAFVSANGTHYTSLTSVNYFGDSTLTATYTYQHGNIDPNGRPLISSCIDTMYDGPMWKIAYDFAPAGTNADGSAVVYGQILREKHPNGTPVSTLTINAKTPNGYSSRTETRGDTPTGGANPSRTFTYNGYLLITTTDFKGISGSQSYDTNRYLASVTDRRGVATLYTCDPLNGNTTQVTYPSTPGDNLPMPANPPTPAMVLQYDYGTGTDRHYLWSITNGTNNINTYTRDTTTHQITRIDYPDTNFEKFTYNSFGQKLTHTLRDGSVETWQYDGAGRVTSFWDAAHPITGNPTTRYLYDSLGRVWKTTECRGSSPGDPTYTTIFEYNSRGQLTKQTHPPDAQGNTTYVQSTYNPNGTLASTADELIHTTSYMYDDYKRVRTITTPTLHTTTTFYDLNGVGEDYDHVDAKPTKVSSPMGKTVTTAYDENLRVVSTTALGDSKVLSGTTRYGYDANGNRTTVTDPNGNVTTTWYDKQNRVAFIDDPMINDPIVPHKNSDGHTVSYFYSAGGSKIQERRVDSKICKYTYDKMGRMNTKSGYRTDTFWTDTFPDVTVFAHDVLGNVKEITDPNGNKYDYVYDSLKRKTKVTYPADASGVQRTEIFHYDIANHLDKYTNPATQVETLVYDNWGRLTNTSWSGGSAPSVQTLYDDASRPQSITTSDGTSVAYGYDNANVKLYEDQTLTGLPTHRVQTDPDADGNRTDLLVQTGGSTNYSVTYQYTSRSGVSQISDGAHTFTYHYQDNNGNVHSRVGESLGDATTFTYNPMNWLVQAAQTGPNGSPLETMNYDYSRRGTLRDSYASGSNTGDSFTYDDSRDQLIGALYSATGVSGTSPNPQNPQRSVTYTCDALDRNAAAVSDSSGTTNTNYTKDALNQYTSIKVGSVTMPLAYDQNFNLTNYNNWSYSYNAMNRMTSATNLNVNPVHWATFVYDGMGRCVKRVIDSTTTVITYDGWRPIAEWNSDGSLAATNVYGIGIDEPLYTSNSIGKFFFKSDALGNVRFVLNGAGTLVEQYTYDAFGTPTVRNGAGTVIVDSAGSPVSAIGNRFMHKGREYLSSLGLYDNRKRIYHPGLGKFLQTDPIGLAGDPMNLYRFCGHNPLTGSDPMGEDDSTDPGDSDPSFQFDFGGTGASSGLSYPSFFADQGAYDAPIADVNAYYTAFNASYAPGGFSGSSTFQISDSIQPSIFPTVGFGAGDQSNYSYADSNSAGSGANAPMSSLFGLQGTGGKSCAELADQIQDVRNELAKRADDLRANIYNLPAGPGPGTVAGHVQQFQDKQTQLRNLLDEYYTNGCQDPIPIDAWAYATGQAPQQTQLQAQPIQQSDLMNSAFMTQMSKTTGLTGGALIIYVIISEGSRAIPLRNAIPVP